MLRGNNTLVARRLFCCVVGVSVLGCVGLANAQTIPIAGTGYNANTVLGVGQTWPGGITATVDGGTLSTGNTWYALGADTTSGYTSTGLPMGSTFTVADATTGGDTFQLQSTSVNNSIFLAHDYGLSTATFTLSQPAVYKSLSFLGADGNGAANIFVTLNYVGGTTLSGTLNGLDWFTASNIAYYANGRVASGGFANLTSGSNSAVPALHYYDLTGLPTVNNLMSISISFSGAGTNTHPDFLGISGGLVNAWTGASSNIWSLAGSDTNWNSPTQTYTDNSIIAFNNSAINAAITIPSTVQPSSVTFNNNMLPYSFTGAAISGTGSVALSTSAGLVTYNSPNTYSGATTISGGTLVVANPLAVQNSPVSVGVANGLVFATGTTAATLGGLAGSGKLALQDLSSSPLALTVGSSASSAYSGSLIGAGSLTKIGSGTQTLSGSNTYTGPTTVNAGILSVTGTLAGGGAITVGPTGTLNATGVIAGASSLAYGSTGLSTLSGANTYTGGTTISAGTLQIGNGGSTGVLPTAGGIVNNSTLAYSYNSTTPFSLATFSAVSGSGNLAATAGSIAINGNMTTTGFQSYTTNGAAALYSGLQVLANTTLTGSAITLSGDAGEEVSSGNNSLTLSTSAVNGPINLNISLGRANSFYQLSSFVASAGTGAINVTGSGPASSGWNGTPVTLTGAVNITGNQSAVNPIPLTINATANSTISGQLSGPLSLVMNGPAALTLSNANLNTGTTIVNGGTLAMANASALAGSTFDTSGAGLLSFGTLTSASLGGLQGTGSLSMLNVNQAPLLLAVGGNGASTVFNGNLSDSGSGAILSKIGTGTLTLNGTNSYSGGTTIAAGLLVFGTPSALPTTPVNNAITLAGGDVAATGPFTTVTGWLNSGLIAASPTSGGIALTTSSTENINLATAGTGAYTGTYGNLSLGSSGTNTYSGTLTPTGTNYNLGGGGGTLVFASPLTGGLNIFGPGVVILTNASNAITGTTTIQSAGALQVSSSGLLQNSPVTLNSTNGLLFSPGLGTATVASLSGSSGLALADTVGGPIALQFGGNNANSSYSGAMTGIGSIIKVGTGTQTLTGASTFTGGVSINGGAVSVNSLSLGGTNASSLGQGPANGSGQSITLNGGMLTYTGAAIGTANATSNSAGVNAIITLLGSGGTLNNSGGNIAFTGGLSGSGNLTIGDVTGTNQVFFNSFTNNPSPNFTGNITIASGGHVQYRTSSTNPFGTVATVTINAGGALQADSGNTAPTTLPNPIVMNGGTLQVQNPGSMTYTGSVTINSGVNSYFDPSGTASPLILSGNLQGSGSVTTVGNPSVTLSGNNSSFTGTWISGGSVTTFTSSAAGSPNANWITNGSTTLSASIAGGGSVSLGALSGATGTLTNPIAGTTSTFSVGGLGLSTTFGGTIVNTGTTALTGLAVVGGKLTLTNTADTYTGLTTISGGTLQAGDGVSTMVSLLGPVKSNSTLVIASPANQPYGGVISGSGSLVKTGTGTLTISANQNYSGPTIITAGTVKLSNQVSGFGGNGVGYTINSSGITSSPFPATNVLQLTDGVNSEARTAFYDWKVPVNAAFTASFVYTPTPGADGVAFVMQNDNRALTAIGGGGGSFGYGSGNPITPSAAVELNIYTGAAGGVGTVFATSGSVPGNNPTTPVVLNSGDPILVTLSYNGSTSLTETLVDQSNGNTYSTTYGTNSLGSGLASIVGGTSAYIGFTGATGGVNSTQKISNFTFAPAALSNNILSTSTAMTLAAGATLDLYGASQTLGSLTGAGTVTNTNPGTTPRLTAGGDNSVQTFSGLLQDGSGTLSVAKAGAGMWTLSSNNTYSGGTVISGGTLQIGSGGATGSLGSGGITNNASLSFNRSDAALTINVPITGSGAVTQNGSGMTTLVLNNSYSGGTSINGGTLQVGTGGSTGSLGSGPVVNNSQLVLNRSDAFFALANVMSGTGALYQNGGGSAALNGSGSAFTGPITITSGNLYINGSNATSAITVAAGTTLGGKGTVSQATATLQDSSSIEAGENGHGSLTVAGLNFQNSANINISNITQYTSQAAIIVTGSNGLSAQGSTNSLNFQLGGPAPSNTVPQTSHLIAYSGSIQGTGLSGLTNNNLTNNLVGFNFNRGTINLLPAGTDPGYIDVQYYTDYPIWTGKGNGIWNTSAVGQASDNNWKLASSSTTNVNFLAGDAVVFDDSAANTNVSLNNTTGNVDPTSVTFNNNTASYTLSGSNAIEGSAVLVMNGTGSVTITNANTYFGGTTINAGLLNIANSSALGSAANYAANATVFNINGGTIDNASGAPLTTDNYPINWNGSFAFKGSNTLNLGTGGVTLGSSSAAVYLSGSTLTIASPISDNGLGYGFTESGNGMLLLTASNTYSGPTVVNGGTLSVGNGGVGASIGSTSGVSLGANALLVFNLSDTQTFSPSITGSGSVIQTGAGLLTLTNSNSYTGGTTVSSGTLQLSAGGPTGTLGTNSTVTVNGAATLLLNASNALGSSGSSTFLTVNSNGIVKANAGFRVPLWNTVNVTGGTLTSAAGNGDGNGNFSLSGQVNATSDLVGNPAAITATQVSLVTNAVVNVTRGPANPAADLVVRSVISSFPSGTGLTLQGNGITQLTGANTYNGGTFLAGGTLQVGNNSALGASTGGLTVAPAALVDINGFSPSVGPLNGGGLIDNVTGFGSPTLTIGGGGGNGTFAGTIQNTTGSTTLVKTGTGTQVLSGTNSYTGGTVINGGALNFVPSALPYTTSPPNITFGGGTLQWAAGNTLDVSAGIAPIPPSVTAGFDTNGNNITLATALSGSGGVTKAGAGALTLPVAESYIGATNITGGTLNVAHPEALANSTVNVQVNNGLTFTGPAAAAATLGGLSGTGNVNLGGTALTVANSGYSAYAGSLSGGNGLTKTGTGTFVLSGANTYNGATSISGGILQIRAAAPLAPLATGLVYQLDASSAGNYVLGNGFVTQLNDLTGNGNNFTNPTSAVAVVNGGSAFNGNNVLNFNDTANATLTLATPSNPQTVFIVEKVTAAISGDDGIFGRTGADHGIRVGAGPIIFNPGNVNDFTFTNGSLYVNGVFQSGNATAGAPQLLEAYAGTNNGLPWPSTSLSNSFDARYFDGEIGEVLAYNFTLSAAQRQQVEAYLMNKWLGVQTGTSTSVLPSTTPLSISNGGTFDMTNGTQTIASLTSTDGQGSMVLLGSGILTVGDSTSTVFDGSISGAGGSLVKQGAGTLILGSSTAVITSGSSFSGNITINAGTLVGAALSGGGNSAFGAQSNARTITINAGGTLQLDAPNMFGPAFNSTTAPTLNINGGTVTNADPAGSGAINSALNNIVLDNGTLTATTGQHGGYAAWNVNGTITSSGNSQISTSDPVYGTVMLSSVGNHISTINVTNGTLTVSAPLVQDNVDSVVSGLSLTGSGTLILSGSDDYTGGTFVNSGLLIAQSVTALPAGSNLFVGATASSFAPVVAGPPASLSAEVAAVPEPGTLMLLLIAAVSSAGFYCRFRRSRACVAR
jgi:fibronectin-binding autotransporter adhesin